MEKYTSEEADNLIEKWTPRFQGYQSSFGAEVYGFDYLDKVEVGDNEYEVWVQSDKITRQQLMEVIPSNNKLLQFWLEDQKTKQEED